jgi:hypothetical protein
VRDASELVLPVERVAAVLRLSDGSRHDVHVFVPYGDDVRDLMESPLPFLPAREGDRIRLYARASLMCVSVTAPPPALDGDAPTPRECKATIHLAGGVALTGQLRYVAPIERRRVADFLNEDGRTFPLYGDGEIHHVAKAHVLYVEEL